MLEQTRVIESLIGPVMPIVDIIEYIGYSRSGITSAMKDYKDKISPCETFVSLPTSGGTQRFRCLNRQGMDYLFAIIHPSKSKMSLDDLLEFRKSTLEKLSESRDLVPLETGPNIRAELEEARDLAAICGKSPEQFQAVILRKHGKVELADVLAPPIVRGEPGWHKPGDLARQCGLTAEQFNNWLNNNPKDPDRRPFQYRDHDTRLWRLTPLGMEHGAEYPFTVWENGHTEVRIKWRDSILKACGLKRDLAPDQMALPERAGGNR